MCIKLCNCQQLFISSLVTAKIIHCFFFFLSQRSREWAKATESSWSWINPSSHLLDSQSLWAILSHQMEGFTTGCTGTVMGQPGDGDAGPQVIDRSSPTSASGTASHAVPAEMVFTWRLRSRNCCYTRGRYLSWCRRVFYTFLKVGSVSSYWTWSYLSA